MLKPKYENLRKINLQLFAAGSDDEIDLDDIELEDDDEGIEIDLDDFEIDDDDDDDDESEEDDDSEDDKSKEKTKEKTKDNKDNKSKDTKEKMVPLKALEAEREKWRKKLQAAQTNKNDTSKKDTGTSDVSLDKQKLIDAGFDDDTADTLVKVLKATNGKAADIEKSVNKKFRNQEFKELAKDPLYADIEDYRDDLEELSDKTGMSIEQCYLAMYGKQKLLGKRSDIETEVEQRVLANLKKKGSMKLDTSDNGEIDTKSKKITLSRDEMQIAKMSGMTPQQYYAMKHSKSADRFDKILSKKKK